MAPSTFASAAASSNSNSSQTRSDAGSEWTRRTNGATQTFRRPSVATTVSNSNHTREVSAEAQPARYVPPHRNGTVTDARYTKDQLLELYKTQSEHGGSQRDSLTSLYVGGWGPNMENGPATPGGWNRRDVSSGEHAPTSDVCWEGDGSVVPLGLLDLAEDEKELFTTSVNSVLKPPTANATPREGVALRKISISQNPNSPGHFGLNSPTTTRPGGRRRETSESYPFPSNPLASPKPRDEGRTASPPAALRRRATDYKDSPVEPHFINTDVKSAIEPSDSSKTPFNNNLNRVATNQASAGVPASPSPWATGQQAGGFSPMGTFGNFANPAGTPLDKRPGFGGGRAESRFKGLMSKESNDNIGQALKEKSSLSNIGAAGGIAHWRSGAPDPSMQPHAENDTEGLSGSAALGGGEEISPPRPRAFQGLGTPSRQPSRDDFGFAAFGMTPDSGFRGAHDQHHTPQTKGQHQPGDTMSPTNTNPYQSPDQDHPGLEDIDTDGSDVQSAHLPGLGGFMGDTAQPGHGHHGGLHGFNQVPGAPPSDRSQTSSVGPQRAFPGLSGLGAGTLSGLGGTSAWGNSQGIIGTPTRERAGLSGFGDGFGSSAELQSPSLAGLGPSSFFGAGNNVPGAGRGSSRLGSLFASSTQEHGRTQHEDNKGSAIGATGPSGLSREIEGDFAGAGNEQDQQAFGDAGTGFGTSGAHAQQPGSSASNQPPTAQQKTMVMPDRMRWIYRDPQGNTQGPWSGLEMHDWYKAGFFSPELLVKKYEDPEYEPLAQLIRRIGNSREPFLVPQIGIPHGQPTQASWTAGPMTTPAGAQPPFANSFPSFGTTLTAEQQNALERRKQEEQYLMARQKEHLAHQQMAQRLQGPSQHGLLSHQLQHHASAQSLHSQPSFSNIASPAGAFPTSASSGPGQSQHAPGFFDNSLNHGRGFGNIGGGLSSLGNIREQELPGMMDNMSVDASKQAFYGAPGQPFGQRQSQQDSNMHAQQVSNMLDDRARLEREQAQHDSEQGHSLDQPISDERFREFQELQEQNRRNDGAVGLDEQQEQESELERVQRDALDAQSKTARQVAEQIHQQEPQSLTEQVQQAMSAQQSPAGQSPWAKIDAVLPQPFPPAPSQSPLPAPAAQRNRSNVADALHAESRSRSQTPSIDTPSATLAPWAAQISETSKGPSLREIQEAEAKSAAKAEALAAEARRAQLEKESLIQVQAAQPIVGLPASSTWASTNTASPVSSTAPSAWAKAVKPVATPATAKSMAQIQKEEEARKKKIAAAAATQQAAALGSAAATAQGKRYAELASKVAAANAAAPNAPTGTWTTVGASGKVKPPVAATTPVKAPSASVASPAASVASATKKPIAPMRITTTGGSSGVNAQEEFKKWAANELRHDLGKDVRAEDFVTNLLALPGEIDILSEAIHSNTNTIDSRHFADEFVRRRRLADKGVFDGSTAGKSASPANIDTSRNADGWSEVAKKGPKEAPKEDVSTSVFKVVAAKKKGSKR